MGDIVLWWLGVEALGLVAFPLAFSLFKNLPDRGYTFAKALGLLTVSYVLWMGGSLHLLPNRWLTIVLLMGALGLLSWLLARRKPIASFFKKEWGLVLMVESLFLLFFAVELLLRAYDPSIASTEKPMDFAFLNANLRTTYFPPADPWLSGFSMSYYYFGYLMMAVLTKLTGVPAAVGYNLALATLFALTAVGAFGVVYNLVRLHGRHSPRVAEAFGLLAAFLVLIIGNLEGLLEIAYAHNLGSPGFWGWVGIKDLTQPYASQEWFPTGHWWWWRATRVIDTLKDGQSLDYTITEFPFFSFYLGDLHPHVMSLPFLLLFLALVLNLFYSTQPLGLTWLRANPLMGAYLPLALGGLAFLNSWDFPVFALLLAAVILIHSYFTREQKGLRLGAKGLLFLAAVLAAIVLYIPFFLDFQGQASGVLPVKEIGTRPLHFFLFWGLFLVVLFPFLLSQIKVLRGLNVNSFLIAVLPVLLPWVVWAGVAVLLSRGELVAGKLVDLLPWMGALALTLALLQGWIKQGGSRAMVFALFLVVLGGFLTYGVELFYILDVFNSRMNTVFKLYYQAWLLLALASAWGIYYLGFHWKGKALKAVWIMVLAIGFFASLAYPAAAIATRGRTSSGGLTLDGLDYLRRGQPGVYEAMETLNRLGREGEVVLEAPGDSYTEASRLSGSSGIPTVLGWGGHERQWRGSYRPMGSRAKDIDTIYFTPDIEEALPLLDKYKVTYVYVGPRERMKYPREGLEKFPSFMGVVFQKEDAAIYRRR